MNKAKRTQIQQGLIKYRLLSMLYNDSEVSKVMAKDMRIPLKKYRKDVAQILINIFEERYLDLLTECDFKMMQEHDIQLKMLNVTFDNLKKDHIKDAEKRIEKRQINLRKKRKK